MQNPWAELPALISPKPYDQQDATFAFTVWSRPNADEWRSAHPVTYTRHGRNALTTFFS